MDDVRVLADAAAVEAALDPIRASILDALTDPGSAATVAAAVGSTRQKVNYHLKALEAHGLVELAEERRWGGITERLVRRSARARTEPERIGRTSSSPRWPTAGVQYSTTSSATSNEAR
jgi:DNA-binding transcriptional ArsR family regulator